MRARQFPGQEQQVFEFYAQNPQAMAEIRAPIFEDKVVDFIAELCDVTERKVDRETLFLDPGRGGREAEGEISRRVRCAITLRGNGRMARGGALYM